MNLLAIDTSTDIASVALAISEDILSEEQSGIRQHAQLLLPMIERLLNKAGWQLNQLDGIVYGRGPGSFTGLRIACAIAKGLAYAEELPVFPVSTLAALAYDAAKKNPTEEMQILSLLDARMNEVYWACFSPGQYQAEEQVSNPANIIIPENHPLLLTGWGYEPYMDQLPQAISTRIMNHFSNHPHAETMIHLVRRGHIEATTAKEALPIYLRNQVVHSTIKNSC